MTDPVPAGIRRNNPFNIRDNPANQWLGQIGAENGFCIMDTAAAGLTDGMHLHLNYQIRHGLKTVAALIERQAPPADHNDTDAYVAAMTSHMGVAAGDAVDLTSVPTLSRWASGIVMQENGQQPYSDVLIDTCAEAALVRAGVPAAQPATA